MSDYLKAYQRSLEDPEGFAGRKVDSIAFD